jgi:hypothetical protein
MLSMGSKRKSTLFIILFSLFSSNCFANTAAYGEYKPDYCENDDHVAGCIDQDFDTTDEDLSTILTVSNALKKQELSENLKRTAIIKLMEGKRDLLAPYPDLYEHKAGRDKLYYEGTIGQKFAMTPSTYGTPGQRYNSGYEASCFNNDENIKSKLDEMDKGFDEYRKKVNKPELHLNMLANALLGAVAAEEGIEQRPGLNNRIETIDKNIENYEETILKGRYGFINTFGKVSTSTSPCYPQQSHAFMDQDVLEAKCLAYEEMLVGLPYKILKLKEEKRKTENKVKMIDQTIFSNSFYTELSGPGDSVSNWWSNIGVDKKNKHELGKYKKSKFLEEGLASLRSIETDNFVTGLKEKLARSNEILKSTDGGVSGEETARQLLLKTLEDNPEFRKKIEGLYKVEVGEYVDETDEAIKEICDSDEDDLIRIPQLVEAAEKEYLELASRELDEYADLKLVLNSHRSAHCTLLREEHASHWFRNSIGISGRTASMIGTGAIALGAGVAAGFGCVPCLAVAGTAGVGSAGLSYESARESERKANILRGLANNGLARQEDAREFMREAQAGWIFMGVDILMAPLGFKGGAAYKAGTLVSKGRKSINHSALGKNKSFFKSLVNGLPEDEYLKVMGQVEKMSDADKAIMAERLKDLDKMSDAEKLVLIEKVLADNKIVIPNAVAINNRVLSQIDNNPKMQEDIKSRYSDQMVNLAIVAGSADEKAFIRMVGIMEKKGCGGFCRKNKLTPEEVEREYQRRFTQCKG